MSTVLCPMNEGWDCTSHPRLRSDPVTLSIIPEMFQIATGMRHIAAQGIVHLDLATRNILLTHPDELVKIADFGLSRYSRWQRRSNWLNNV